MELLKTPNEEKEKLEKAEAIEDCRTFFSCTHGYIKYRESHYKKTFLIFLIDSLNSLYQAIDAEDKKEAPDNG